MTVKMLTWSEKQDSDDDEPPVVFWGMHGTSTYNRVVG